nr:S49 family peptidase [candidate division Zixibacteria bacterium]
MLRTILILVLILTIFVMPVMAQNVNDYYSRYQFLMASPGAFDDGLVGFDNPAALSLLNRMESRFFWSTDGVDASSFNNWGLFLGVPHLGFGVQRQNEGDYHVTDYRFGTSFGSPATMFGLAYGWTTGDKHLFDRKRIASVGMLMRPCRYISLGLVGNFSVEDDWNEGVAEVGLRPLGNSRLTLFADGAIERDMSFSDAPWSAGAAVEVAPGVNLVGRYFDSEAFTFGFTFNFGRNGIGAQSHYDKNQDLSSYSYHVRLGGQRKSFVPVLFDENNRYLPLDLNGTVDYHKYVLFDDKTLRFKDLLDYIRAASDDPRVAVIALNLSSLRIYGEHAWEIREELQAARAAGKKVIAFFDRAGMTNYHLASVADRVVMDPEGSLQLPGYILGRTFFKATLEKLGLGFDEWRFFKYKSAAEALSRESMSEADREQRQNFVDDAYEIVRADVCQSRNLTEKQFDDVVDNQGFLMADEALEAGLVDTLARWSDKNDVITAYYGRRLGGLAAGDLLDLALNREDWGPRPEIAIVYGLGECAMDQGIRARWLERVFLSLARNRQIKAVVFRVDSPGGDGLASDLVAEAVRECAQKKPVVISQGRVAGSGGYWISMYGNEIIAGPNTITGSIGVIGGWLYDKQIGEKLGMSADFVKRGKHAELGFGIRLPFLNMTIPSRNLDREERAEMERLIRAFYDDFVRKVADGRDLPVERVLEIAEGHFYSGLDGMEIGLVDRIGGLNTAVAAARTRAGIAPGDKIDLIEIPKYKGLFDFSPFPKIPSPFETYFENDDILRYLKVAAEHNGRALPMMIPGTYPVMDQ